MRPSALAGAPGFEVSLEGFASEVLELWGRRGSTERVRQWVANGPLADGLVSKSRPSSLSGREFGAGAHSGGSGGLWERLSIGKTQFRRLFQLHFFTFFN